MIRHRFIITIAATVLLSGAAFAQAPEQAPGSAPGLALDPPTAPPIAPARGGGGQHRMQQLHDRLAITPAQQPQWDALLAALRENRAAMRANPLARGLRGGQLAAPQAMRAAADLARQRADAIGRMVGPVDALYATFSPQQRQAADQAFAHMVHGRG